MRIHPLLLWCGSLLLAAGTASAKEEPVHLDPLRLPTIDGRETIDLASLRGTKLLLVEFASW
jgi:hypothetical protein